MASVTDTLLDKVAEGRRDAIDACVDRYAPFVWSLARRFHGTTADAEDAVQEIFIDLWKHADRYDPTLGAESTFVAMVARRRLIDAARRRARRPEIDSIQGDIAERSPSAEERLEASEEAASVRQLMRRLKPDEQLVLELAIVHGATQQQISEWLEMPLGTVKSHARRGLKRLRELTGAVPRGGES